MIPNHLFFFLESPSLFALFGFHFSPTFFSIPFVFDQKKEDPIYHDDDVFLSFLCYFSLQKMETWPNFHTSRKLNRRKKKAKKIFVLLIDWQIIKVDWITNVQFILFFLLLVTRFREIFHYNMRWYLFLLLFIFYSIQATPTRSNLMNLNFLSTPRLNSSLGKFLLQKNYRKF